MNGNKVARVLNRIFQIGFFICLAITSASIFVFGFTKDTQTVTGADGKQTTVAIKYSTRAHLLIYLSALLIAVLFCVLYYFSKRNYRLTNPTAKMPAEKKFRLILFTAVGIYFLVLLYVGWEIQIYPRTDLKQVHDFAMDFAESNSFQSVRDAISGGNNYMARYPNNFAIMFLLSVYYRILYLIFGSVPLYGPVVLNCVALAVSVLFTILIAKQMWGRRKAVLVMIMLFLFAPMYAYTPFFYTDSLSMPFGVIGIYLFILALKTDKSHRVKKYVLLFVSGAVIFVGFKVKGSLIIVLAAAVIYALLKCKFKEFLCVAMALIVGFGSFFLMFKAGYSALNLVTEEQAERFEYPYTHWVMMGLKGRGGYNSEDSQYTYKFKTKEAKKEANIRVIKKRVKSLIKNNRVADHLIRKASWMWCDGTYFIPGHIKNYVHRSWIHDFVLRDGKYYYLFFGYCNAYQLVLLFMMLMSLLKGIIRPKIKFTVFLKIITCGIFLFLLIWESRSRYLFDLTPVFILIAADGVFFSTDSVTKLFRKIRKKPEIIDAKSSDITESSDEGLDQEETTDNTVSETTIES